MTQEFISKLNVWQRVCAVRSEMPAVDRNKTIGEGEYAYDVTTHDEINRHLCPLMSKHGLVDVLEPLGMQIVDTGILYGKSGRQRQLLQHRGTFLYRVVNVDNPEDSIEVEVTGWGEDHGDKGPGKASTYGFKEGRKKVFSIGTGEDEEARTDESKIHSQVAETLSPAQIDEIIVLADELFGKRADNTIHRLLEKVFQVPHVSDIPAMHFENAKNALKKQHEREKKAAAKKEAEEWAEEHKKASESDTTKGKEEPGADG